MLLKPLWGACVGVNVKLKGRSSFIKRQMGGGLTSCVRLKPHYLVFTTRRGGRAMLSVRAGEDGDRRRSGVSDLS